MNRQYQNFDLEISRATEGYTARVLRSPGGEGSHTFINPVSADDFELLFYQIIAARIVRSMASTQGTKLRRVGTALFKAIFGGDVLHCYMRSLGMCTDDTGLRIRLRFAGTPELVNLPWELLYDEGMSRWVALGLDTPLVRYLQHPSHLMPLRVFGALRVLIVVSNPSDTVQLDVEGEVASVESALAQLAAADLGSVVFESLRHPTPELLNRRLIAETWHVLHFIGHGVFDRTIGGGGLVLEDGRGKARNITAERFAVMLQGRALKLVVLNSCEGARVADNDMRSGVAQSLIAQGVPAVVAMQFPITDTAALAFTRTFYYALSLGTSLERAVVEARRAIFQESELEWATPSLYLRSDSGILFEIERRVEQLPAIGETAIEPVPAAAPTPDLPASQQSASNNRESVTGRDQSPQATSTHPVWEPYTERARRTIVHAQEEAERLGNSYIGTEHLLLGIIAERESLGADILETLGVNLIEVRREIDAIVGRGGQTVRQEMVFTPRSKRVIELAFEEALALNHNYIGTEHLLTGLVSEGEGVAARVLANLGVTVARVRATASRLRESHKS